MAEITRERWIECFETGFKRGAAERKKRPENRHDEITQDDEVEGEAELAALEAGYELGKENAVPGASIDIEKKANAAYDRSEHSAGLDRWS